MSRSYRKLSIFGNGGGSEKNDKKRANKKFRKINKMILDNGEPEELLVDVKEVSDNWCFSKDGKSYWHPSKDNKMNEYYQKCMRK